MGIDSFFDLAEGVLDAFAGAPAPPARPTARTTASPSPPPAAIATPSAIAAGPEPDRRRLAGGTVAIAARGYRIVESIDATSGRTAWVVTNGRDRVECNGAELAIRVRDALG